MKWDIENIEKSGFIKVRLHGCFSLDEMRQALKDLFSRQYWKPGKPILFDDTGLDLTGVDLDEIRVSSQIYLDYSSDYDGSKIAVLAGSVADFARGRQFELLRELVAVLAGG